MNESKALSQKVFYGNFTEDMKSKIINNGGSVSSVVDDNVTHFLVPTFHDMLKATNDYKKFLEKKVTVWTFLELDQALSKSSPKSNEEVKQDSNKNTNIDSGKPSALSYYPYYSKESNFRGVLPNQNTSILSANDSVTIPTTQSISGFPLSKLPPLNSFVSTERKTSAFELFPTSISSYTDPPRGSLRLSANIYNNHENEIPTNFLYPGVPYSSQLPKPNSLVHSFPPVLTMPTMMPYPTGVTLPSISHFPSVGIQNNSKISKKHINSNHSGGWHGIHSGDPKIPILQNFSPILQRIQIPSITQQLPKIKKDSPSKKRKREESLSEKNTPNKKLKTSLTSEKTEDTTLSDTDRTRASSSIIKMGLKDLITLQILSAGDKVTFKKEGSFSKRRRKLNIDELTR